MKIRIKGDFIRYLLTKGDVERFSQEGYLEEIVNFGQTRLTYCLERVDNSRITANSNANKITVLMRRQAAYEWTGNGPSRI